MAEENPVGLSKTDQNLWGAIVNEAMANTKYSAFALKALEEGHPEIAQIFQEIAGAENIHAINQLKTAGAVRSTAENLRSVTRGEAKEFATLYPKMIRDALDEGRMDAVQAFGVAMDRERHHLENFMKALEELEKKTGQITPNAPESSEPDIQSVRLIAPSPLGQTDASEGATTTEQSTVEARAVAPTYNRAMREVEREKMRVASVRRIREVVFGAQDGLMSTLALVAALAAAISDNSTIVVGGLSAALAGMVSMGTGTYLGSKAEHEIFQAEIEKEAKELETNPAEEMAELVFLYHQQGMTYGQAKELAAHIAEDHDLWLRTLVEKELGIDPEMIGSPTKDALTMGLTFIVAAIVPILPFFWLDGTAAIVMAAIISLGTLFVLGTAKGRLVQKKPLLQGLELLLFGTTAAGLGYLLGEIIPKFF